MEWLSEAKSKNSPSNILQLFVFRAPISMAGRLSHTEVLGESSFFWGGQIAATRRKYTNSPKSPHSGGLVQPSSPKFPKSLTCFSTFPFRIAYSSIQSSTTSLCLFHKNQFAPRYSIITPYYNIDNIIRAYTIPSQRSAFFAPLDSTLIPAFGPSKQHK